MDQRGVTGEEAELRRLECVRTQLFLETGMLERLRSGVWGGEV